MEIINLIFDTKELIKKANEYKLVVDGEFTGERHTKFLCYKFTTINYDNYLEGLNFRAIEVKIMYNKLNECRDKLKIANELNLLDSEKTESLLNEIKSCQDELMKKILYVEELLEKEGEINEYV